MQKNNLIVCGETIRKHRIAWNLTQRQFGSKVGVHFNTINKIENRRGFLVSEKIAFNLANEIVNNPAPENKPVWELIDKWNEEEVT